MSCNSQSPLAGQVRQSSGWSEMYNSMTPVRILETFGLWVETFIPLSHGVVHEAGVPLRPSISTTHRRQEPNGSKLSVAHSLGMSLPIRAAALITEVPAGTSMLWPSISRLTTCVDSRAGVPRSCSCVRVMSCALPVGVQSLRGIS